LVRRVQIALVGLLLVLAAPRVPAGPPTPILIELFTSEGCSDCPAADVLLDTLVTSQPVAGAQVIALEQHVDYWDRLGWKDRFSSPAFTNRQQVYSARLSNGNIYTPQMVVDGVSEFVGSDANAARRAVTKSLAAAHGSLSIQVEELDRGPESAALLVTVTARDLPKSGRGDRADILVAVIEDHLKTDVKRGENRGRVLSHTAVVRQMLPIGEATSSELSTARGEVSLAPDWRRHAIKVVAFVQQRRGGQVLASAVVPLENARP
jgi:hypothetical protein